MDLGKYTEIFIAECRELIESLNLSIVTLETAPGNSGTIDEIFRVAHSLKGVSSTMGYDQMAGLTHEMEALLDLVRAGGATVDEPTISALLACLDMLEQAVDNIEANGTEDIEPTELVARLAALIAAASGSDQPAEAVADSPAHVAGERPAGMPAPHELPPGVDFLHVHVEVDPACESASIRAFMAWSAVEDCGELAWALPGPDEVDTWEHPRVDLLVAADTDDARERIEAAVGRIPEIASVTVELYGASSGGEVALEAVAPRLETTPEAVAEAAVAAPAAAPAPAPAEPAAATGSGIKQRMSGTVRVDAERLDKLMHLMGEVVVHRSNVEAKLREQDLAAALEAVQELRRSTQALQAEVMNVRMVPVETALMRMPRLVRDLCAKLGKEVDLQIVGADTEIDRSVVDALGDPLVHLVRNGLDHGIETPDEREAAGKPRTATLTIGAAHSGGNVVISVRDDGRGVNRDQVVRRAIERGIITPDEGELLDERGAIELLFRAGFSTAEVATDVSGRGVGMDAVRAMCREWGGDVEIESTFGEGSVASIRIPLTLAVMNVLVVQAGARNVAIPIDRIERTIRLADHPRVDMGGGASMIRLDEGVLSVVDLGTAVGYGSTSDPEYGVIIGVGGGQRLVLSVARLIGESETVTKPMPRGVQDEMTFMGAAVQGDGSVVLIVDCERLAATGGRRGPTVATAAATAGERSEGHA